MNEIKLSDSIQNFRYFYIQNRDFYEKDERSWKSMGSEQFTDVFSQNTILGDDFSTRLLGLFTNKDITKVVIWLNGGVFYQCQRFTDLLMANPSNELLQDLFNNLFFSNDSLKSRVNKFKSGIDALYSTYKLNDTIQLNLISQFLGLSQPERYYIYKSQEFTNAEKYFEFETKLIDKSAGGKYEYHHTFSSRILEALRSSGLNHVDYIDVQTFIFRKDWYSEWKFREVADQYEKAVEKAQTQSIEFLMKRIENSKPHPPRITRNTYFYRNPDIAAIVKKLAEGKCDLCESFAPFKNSSGIPYLENHHIVHLANDGRDELDNCVALCPNCHKKMHVLNLDVDQTKLKLLALRRAHDMKERLLIT